MLCHGTTLVYRFKSVVRSEASHHGRGRWWLGEERVTDLNLVLTHHDYFFILMQTQVYFCLYMLQI